jgi:hypothetical protein
VLYARHPRRAGGDGYAGVFDLAAPPLAILSVVAALAAPFAWWAGMTALLAFTVVLMIHHLLALRISRETRTPAALALSGIGALRAYARGWGMLRGLAALLTRRTGR